MFCTKRRLQYPEMYLADIKYRAYSNLRRQTPMVTVFLLSFLLQTVAPNRPSADARNREAQLRLVTTAAARPATSVADETSKQYTAARDEEFVQKFNKLITKLMDFADAYKNDQALDVKKAKAVRKAWLELEKSEAIFRDDKKK